MNEPSKRRVTAPGRTVSHPEDCPGISADEGKRMKELIYPRMLFSAVRKHPDRIAFVDGDQRETLASHLDRSQRLVAAHRSRLGLVKTDTFAVLAGNSRHYVNLWHPALLGGGILNPLNTRLAPAEIAFILKDAGTTVLYTESGFEPAVSYLRDELPELKHIVLMDDGDCPHDIRYRDLVASTSGGMYFEPQEEDLAMLMYTGGTTGLPKGVKHTQRSLTLNVYRLNVMLKFFIEPTSYLNATPMFHAAATLGHESQVPPDPERVTQRPVEPLSSRIGIYGAFWRDRKPFDPTKQVVSAIRICARNRRLWRQIAPTDGTNDHGWKGTSVPL